MTLIEERFVCFFIRRQINKLDIGIMCMLCMCAYVRARARARVCGVKVVSSLENNSRHN